MRSIILLVIAFYSINGFSQDVLKVYTLDKYEIKNQTLDSLFKAFVEGELPCLDQGNNTVPIAYYDANAIGDSNAITLRVIHARDLNEEKCFGYVSYIDSKVFLYDGIDETDFFTKVSATAQMLMISQRITFGNYLINNRDTLYFAGVRPYEAQWIIFEYKDSLFWGTEYDHPCNIKEEKNSTEELLREGWRQP